MKISNFKLGIAIPLTFPFVPAGFFYSFAVMDRPNYIFMHQDNGPIDALRNNLVEQALTEGCSHLIMLDTDMEYHRETIPRLLSHRLPIVGALCYRRYPPFDPLMLRGSPVEGYESVDKWEDGELVEVDATGTGCLMFDTQIFRKMPAPWFKFRPNPNNSIGGVIGEDIGFCWDLKQAGYRIFVDTTVPSNHLTTLAVNDSTYRLYKSMKMKQREHAIARALSSGNEIQ
ncbi:MAG: hypothetical protein BWY95_02007 [Bacteroidetes bacterium ADurb.BinA104]|jgi:hypothetical protein|nr:MAG: hypothetical protein BWY95_02007 [Bacteroidetes bacterium ADurb.BinA104]